MNVIARRVVGFTKKSVRGVVGASREALPLPEAAKPKKKHFVKAKRRLVLAAGGLAYAATNEKFRHGASRYFQGVRKRLREMEQEAERAKAKGSTSTNSSSNSSTSNAGRSSSNGNGGNGNRSMTREELYELARQRDIPGRSTMTKSELEKALGR